MGGGLMQLVAYGAQDIYLTGNPQITFFKVVYRRHTNFSMESIQQTWSGAYTPTGGRQTATISRNGDLIYKMYIEYQTTATTAFQKTNAGHTMIEDVELEIGGQKIDKQSGLYMGTSSELTQRNDTGAFPQADVAFDAAATRNSLFQAMSMSGGVLSGAAAPVNGGNVMRIFTPLLFWFCRNPGLALPLIALQYHEVKLIVNWSTESMIAGNANRGLAVAPELWCDYIYLDTDERRRFAQVSHEYLIEQVQHQSYAAASTLDLSFNHPVKELIWTGARSPYPAGAGGAMVLPVAANPLDTFQLKLNGHDRFAARTVQYFTRQQVYDYHTGFGGSARDSIAVYSFALKPEEHQPSGTCNFSRIDNAQLVHAGVGVAQALEVYAINYNVLRIMSGMGGLAYSN
jgi:hypothetical protein